MVIFARRKACRPMDAFAPRTSGKARRGDLAVADIMVDADGEGFPGARKDVADDAPFA